MENNEEGRRQECGCDLRQNLVLQSQTRIELRSRQRENKDKRYILVSQESCDDIS